MEARKNDPLNISNTRRRTVRLRDTINSLGLSCRDSNGDFLNNTVLNSMIGQHGGGINDVGKKYATGTQTERNTLLTLMRALHRPSEKHPTLPNELMETIVEKLPKTRAEKRVKRTFNSSVRSSPYSRFGIVVMVAIDPLKQDYDEIRSVVVIPHEFVGNNAVRTWFDTTDTSAIVTGVPMTFGELIDVVNNAGTRGHHITARAWAFVGDMYLAEFEAILYS
jgi:hypothetical protein